MGPIGHTVVSTGIGGGIWIATDSGEAVALAVGVGVLMDLDHLYDYYQQYIRGHLNRTYLFLHAWEYSFAGLGILVMVLYHPLLLAIVLAHLAHVTNDHLFNRLHPLAYFITYRVLIGFDAASISPDHDPLTGHRKWLRHIPLGHLLEPWIQRRVHQILSATADPDHQNV